MSKDPSVAEGSKGEFDPKLIMEALVGEMKRMFREELEQLHESIEERLGRPQYNPPRGREEAHIGRGQPVAVDVVDRHSYGGYPDHDLLVGDGRYDGRNRGDRNGEDNNMGSIKMKIPPFQGRNDPKVYLEWERKVELIFECHNYSEAMKVKLAAIEFSDYAIVWWDQLLMNRRRYGDPPIETWEEMKRVMRRRFVPTYFLQGVA